MIERTQDTDSRIVFAEGGDTFLTIEEEAKDDNVLVRIIGKMRSGTYHDFFDEMNALLSVGLNLKLDFSAIEYVSNSYMQALISLQQKAERIGKDIKIINPSESMRKMLDSTGASALLWIEDEV